MNILHIVATLEKAAGTSVFVAELASQQAIAGNNVTILVKSRCAVEHHITSCVRVVTKDDSFALQLSSTTTYSDIVHIHALWDPWLTQMASRFRKQGAKIVWSPHGMLTPWALKNKWPKKFAGLLLYQYWSLRKADMLHATADSEIADIQRLHLSNQTVTAPLGVKVDAAHTVCYTRKKHICFVSRIQRKKGLPNLLKAWAQLPDSIRSGWKIKIAGPDQDNHTAELKALCNELHIGNSIEFLGPIYDSAKDRLFAEAAFSVLPTHSENFGSVVIESLAQGTPVICTKGAPWRDLVDYNCGWWIDIGVEPLVKTLTEALQLFIAQPSAFKLLGQHGLELVRTKYTWPTVTKIMENVYAKLLY